MQNRTEKVKIKEEGGMKRKMKNFSRNKGITLIALVITIIVLLILAAISIATLTGDNGILTKANNAKSQTDEANAKEKVQMEVYGSYDDNAKLDMNKLKENLGSHLGVKDIEDNETGTDRKLKFKLDGYNVEVDSKGQVTIGDTTPPPTETIPLEKAKDDETIFDEKTTLEDKYGNKVVVPENFKIAKDSATDVTGGVVIEDASEEPTAGSQFVWIPVGEVKTDEGTENIKLSRYTFADETNDKDSEGNSLLKGTPIEQGDKAINDFTENLTGNTDASTPNAVADTEIYNAFTAKTEDGKTKTKVEKVGGYYVGRYEARTNEPLDAQSNDDDSLPQITVKAEDSVYNWVTQPQASKLSKEMYQNKSFKSDLMNSYAWDTAIVFLQTFDDRKEKETPYSYQNSLNKGYLATTGTNNLEANNDKICNIWDMASNCYELTTETSSSISNPCTGRGGNYDSGSSCTSRRISTLGGKKYSFRPLLIM